MNRPRATNYQPVSLTRHAHAPMALFLYSTPYTIIMWVYGKKKPATSHAHYRFLQCLDGVAREPGAAGSYTERTRRGNCGAMYRMRQVDKYTFFFLAQKSATQRLRAASLSDSFVLVAHCGFLGLHGPGRKTPEHAGTERLGLPASFATFLAPAAQQTEIK